MFAVAALTAATLTAALSVGGCAVTTLSSGGAEPPASKLKRPLPSTNETGAMADDGRYQLSAEEQALNCRKLTGRMQVRLMQVRDAAPEVSGGARAMQGAANSVFGGTTRGLDGTAERRRDLALLDAYNRRLAEKGCPTYDLAKELRGGAGNALPRPVVPEKKR